MSRVLLEVGPRRTACILQDCLKRRDGQEGTVLRIRPKDTRHEIANDEWKAGKVLAGMRRPTFNHQKAPARLEKSRAGVSGGMRSIPGMRRQGRVIGTEGHSPIFSAHLYDGVFHVPPVNSTFRTRQDRLEESCIHCRIDGCGQQGDKAHSWREPSRHSFLIHHISSSSHELRTSTEYP